MGTNKTIGYILSIVGIVGLASTTFPGIQQQLGLEALSKTALMIVSGVIVAAGIFFLIKEGSPKKKVKDVPVYEEGQLVEYKRHGKK